MSNIKGLTPDLLIIDDIHPENGHFKMRENLTKRQIFNRCVNTNHDTENKHYEINCKLGLWGVSGSSNKAVYSEAWHYWQQYLIDGEYEGLLNEAI